MISIPFSGSKRYSYKNVRRIVEQGGYTAVYEPFGGSCVLSVNLLNDGLVKKAVVNDYDRFFDEYEAYLDLKDKLVNKCLDYGMIKSDKPLPEDQAIYLQNLILKYVPENSNMWNLVCSGHNFTHSIAGVLRKAVIADFKYLRCDISTDKQREYLAAFNRCSIEHLDWFDFINKYSFNSNDLIILDPPYLDTAQQQYNGQFGFKDTVKLIKSIKRLECDFIFFNHDVDKVKELLDGIDSTIEFIGNDSINANRNRKDVMAYVRNR